MDNGEICKMQYLESNVLEKILEEAKMNDNIIREICFKDCNENNLEFKKLEVSNVKFVNCKCISSKFAEGYFTKVIFKDCDFSNTDFSESSFVEV